MPFCINCGNEVQADYEFCPECGHLITPMPESDTSNTSEKTKICPQCKSRVSEDLFYCLNCGYSFPNHRDENNNIRHGYDESPVANSEINKVKKPVSRRKAKPEIWRNKWIAFFLCLVFGFLGIHRFYEGKVFTGILFLLTFGFFGLGIFIDLIRIILKPNPYLAK